MTKHRECDGCFDFTNERGLNPCLSSLARHPFHKVNLGRSNFRPCNEEDLYCDSCRNEYDFCQRCAAAISLENQVKIYTSR